MTATATASLPSKRYPRPSAKLGAAVLCALCLVAGFSIARATSSSGGYTGYSSQMMGNLALQGYVPVDALLRNISSVRTLVHGTAGEPTLYQLGQKDLGQGVSADVVLQGNPLMQIPSFEQDMLYGVPTHAGTAFDPKTSIGRERLRVVEAAGACLDFSLKGASPPPSLREFCGFMAMDHQMGALAYPPTR